MPIRECSDGTWIADVSVARVVSNTGIFPQTTYSLVILPDMATDVMCMCHLGTRTSSDPSGGERSYGGLLAGGVPVGGVPGGLPQRQLLRYPSKMLGRPSRCSGFLAHFVHRSCSCVCWIDCVPALPHLRVPIRECSDGTWIANVSVARVVSNTGIFRKRRTLR